MSEKKKDKKKKKYAEEEIDGCEGTSTLKGKIDKKKKLKAKKQTIVYGGVNSERVTPESFDEFAKSQHIDDYLNPMCDAEDHVCVCGKEIERGYVHFDDSAGPPETWTKSQIDGFMRANTDVIKGEYKKTTDGEYRKIIKELESVPA